MDSVNEFGSVFVWEEGVCIESVYLFWAFTCLFCIYFSYFTQSTLLSNYIKRELRCQIFILLVNGN